MKLDEGVHKRLSEQLGQKIPPASDESFWPFLENLYSTHPAEAAEIEENIIFDDLGDPELEAQRADARAVSLRMVWRRALYRFDEVRQTWHLHRGKLLGWGLLAFMSFFIPTFFFRPTPQVAAAEVQTAAVAKPAKKAPAKKPEVNNEPLLIEQPQDDPTPSAPLVTQSAEPVVPLTTDETAAGTSSLRSYSKEIAETPAPLGGFHREGAPSPAAAGNDPFAQGEGRRPSGLSAYAKERPEQEARAGLSAYAREPDTNPLRTPGDPGVSGGAGGEAGGGGAGGGDENNGDPLFENGGVAREYVEVSAQPSAPQDDLFATPPTDGDGGAFASPLPADGASYKTGDTVEAELVVGLIALGEDALPVVAKGRDGSVWQGQAVLNEGGRIDIRLTDVHKGAGSQSLEAVALADDGYAGVPASVKETTPALASDLARGALRGASEFVEGLRDQSSVTLRDGSAIVNRSAPPLDASVLGSVARLFTPPEGEDQQALVRVAEVPNGTRFQIMVLSDAPPETP